MQPVAAAETWELPAIESVGDLANWLGLNVGELQWFADLRALGYKEDRPRLTHYHYRILAKRFGTIRLIEAPKTRLKDLQRQILAWILAKIPPHPAVHGFVKGRSIKTFVAPHVGQQVVSDIDPICASEARRFYSRPHLPQGAPTSPALANLCSYRVDCRLIALAKSAGAAYTRYADDLAFSGGVEFEKCAERFAIHVAAVLLEEGFTVHHRKTRVMRQGVRQHLAGLAINQGINVPRRDFDLLKAMLTNCVRSGPESQNRDARSRFRPHLEGRVAFVEMINPTRGRRLRMIFDRIRWPE